MVGCKCMGLHLAADTQSLFQPALLGRVQWESFHREMRSVARLPSTTARRSRSLSHGQLLLCSRRDSSCRQRALKCGAAGRTRVEWRGAARGGDRATRGKSGAGGGTGGTSDRDRVDRRFAGTSGGDRGRRLKAVVQQELHEQIREPQIVGISQCQNLNISYEEWIRTTMGN